MMLTANRICYMVAIKDNTPLAFEILRQRHLYTLNELCIAPISARIMW